MFFNDQWLQQQLIYFSMYENQKQVPNFMTDDCSSEIEQLLQMILRNHLELMMRNYFTGQKNCPNPAQENVL